MASLNKVQLIGNLGRDPEVRFNGEGSPMATLQLATSRNWKDGNGERKEETEWHRVVLYGRTAQVVADYVTKGRLIYVEGRLRTRKWQDAVGNDRYITEVVGESLEILSARSVVDSAASAAEAGTMADKDIPGTEEVAIKPRPRRSKAKSE